MSIWSCWPNHFEQVEFEIDENFEKHYKKRTGDEKVDPQLVSQYIGNMVDDADNDYKNITPTKGVDAFVVPEDNPNTHTDKNIRWFNTEKLEKIKQKHEARVDVLATAAENSEIYSHHTDGSSLFMESTPSNEIDASLVDAALDEAKEGAKNALDEELKTLEEYDKKNLKK